MEPIRAKAEAVPKAVVLRKCKHCLQGALWLKRTERVSLNIASEASYVYMLKGQKSIKNFKKCLFWRVFENLKLAVEQYYQTDQF